MTQLIEVAPINSKVADEYSSNAINLYDRASMLMITNQEKYENAAELLKTVKGMAKELEEARKKITNPLDVAKKAVMDLFRKPAENLEKAESTLKRIMISYTQEQEQIRREQEEKLRRQAEAEEARKRKAFEERAKKAEESGKAEKAEELRQKAAEVQVVAPVLASTVQKVAGVSMKKNWKARVINPMAVPREYLVIDEQKLNQVARATQGTLVISGVQFYSEDILASR